MTMRGIKWILVVKCLWLAANLTGWLMGLGSCMTEPNCSLANYGFLPILILLSFPGSLLFFFANEAFIEAGVIFDATPAMSYTFLSLGTITVGYLQWFHVLPALFGNQEMTVLPLNQIITTRATEQAIPPKAARSKQLKTPQIQPLDKAGRSPLERVINRHQRRRLIDSSERRSQSSMRPELSRASRPACNDRKATIPR